MGVIGYTVVGPEDQTLEIKAYKMSLNYYDSEINLMGNDNPILVAAEWDGDTTLYAYSSGRVCSKFNIIDMKTSKVMTVMNAYTDAEDICFSKKDSWDSYKYETSDCAFCPFPHANRCYNAPATLYLKFDGTNFVFDEKAMTKKIDFEKFNHRVEKTRKELVLDSDSSLDKEDQLFANYSILVVEILDLIYSGNADYGWKMAEALLRDREFSHLNIKTFKDDFMCILQKSPHIHNLQNINDNNLTKSESCKHVNDYWPFSEGSQLGN